MNDHDAIDAINKVLAQYYGGALTPVGAMNEIARISGGNKIDHEARS